MNIAIDMVGTKLGSGTRTYNINFCEYLNEISLNHNLYIFTCKDYLKEIKFKDNEKIKYILVPNFLSITILRLLWMQFFLPFHLKILKIQSLFSPMNFSPIFLKLLNIKSILALHSNLPWVLFKMMPGNILRNKLTKFMMQVSIKSCDKLIVDSNFAKKEIIDLLNINSDKVNVVYLGVDKKYLQKKINENYVKNFIYKDYILSVLSCVKYHNIISLIKAFQLLKKEHTSNLRFVLVVQILDKSYYTEIKKYIEENFLSQDIEIFNNLENKYLVNFYKNAKFYIFSSYCEVFGLTSLEAMSQECPVIISKNSALPEINSNAALYFDPDNHEEIKNQMKKLLLDENITKELINYGNANFKRFEWENTVKKTLDIISD